MRAIPIIKRQYLSDGSFISSIAGSTKPGAKKLQFPFDIPTVNTSNDVNLTPGAQTALIATVSILAVGMITTAIIKLKTKK